MSLKSHSQKSANLPFGDLRLDIGRELFLKGWYLDDLFSSACMFVESHVLVDWKVQHELESLPWENGLFSPCCLTSFVLGVLQVPPCCFHYLPLVLLPCFVRA